MGLHYFTPLDQNDFEQLAHTAYLKGLFQPFKGKGCLTTWASQCTELRDELIGLAQQRLLTQTRRYPFNLLPAQLAQQPTGAGTNLLRWRNPDRSSMGVALWERCMESDATPSLLLDDLFALEQQRIVLNMQISLSHTLARQGNDCAIKLAQAEAVYKRCVARRAINPESTS